MSCHFLKTLLLNYKRNAVEIQAVPKRREIWYRNNADLNLLSVGKIVFTYREALNKGKIYSSCLSSKSSSQTHSRIVQTEKPIIVC